MKTSKWVNDMPCFGESHEMVSPCTGQAINGRVKVTGLNIKSRELVWTCCLPQSGQH